MDQNEDFSALRALLASTRQDLPQDTQVDQFLVEFHRRQRAQLLVKQSVFARSAVWIKERLSGMELVPSLSYGGAFAAVAITLFFSFSQQVQVTHTAGQSGLTLRMQPHETAFAMVPVSLGLSSTITPKVAEVPNFTPAHTETSATRYVLATNSQGAHDATVAF